MVAMSWKVGMNVIYSPTTVCAVSHIFHCSAKDRMIKTVREPMLLLILPWCKAEVLHHGQRWQIASRQRELFVQPYKWLAAFQLTIIFMIFMNLTLLPLKTTGLQQYTLKITSDAVVQKLLPNRNIPKHLRLFSTISAWVATIWCARTVQQSKTALSQTYTVMHIMHQVRVVLGAVSDISWLATMQRVSQQLSSKQTHTEQNERLSECLRLLGLLLSRKLDHVSGSEPDHHRALYDG